MQLSVLPHLNLYSGQDSKASTLIAETVQKKMIGADEKALMKSSGANVKVYKAKRKAKLVKESGQVGNNRPYRAPIYQSYRECVKALYR